MQVISPREVVPGMGTVANPAALYDGADVFPYYEVSPRAGGGNVVLGADRCRREALPKILAS